MTRVVSGAGVIGLACAYELSDLGLEVTVLDAGAVGAGASAGNAGWITPFLSVPRAVPGAVRDAVRSLFSSAAPARLRPQDRKSTRLNSSHVKISYAVFCLK